MKSIGLVLWGALALLLGSCDAQAGSEFQYMFVGGALNTCSSMSLRHCNDSLDQLLKRNKLGLESFKAMENFHINEQSYRKAKHNEFWQQLPKATTQILDGKIKPLSAHQGTRFVSRKDFEESMGGVLSDKVANKTKIIDFLADYFEVAQDQDKPEQVFLANSKNPFSPAILQKFVQMAHASGKLTTKQRPRVLFMTSSGYNPLSAVAFYQQVFEQAGAEAVWFPLDKAMRGAMDDGRCEDLASYHQKLLGRFNRDGVFQELFQYQKYYCQNPKKLNALLHSAQGLFINGGDQSLSRAAFQTKKGDSPQLKLLRQLAGQGKIVVGGTSAGAAVQSGGDWGGRPIPMITSGTSYQGLVGGAIAEAPPPEGCVGDECGSRHYDTLTYEPRGGLGLLPAGIFDTHFSERGRQLRLIQLQVSTGIPYAFGIDETTALLGKTTSDGYLLKVFGKGGVWVFDTKKASKQAKNGVVHISGVKAHYLTINDHIIIGRDGTMKIVISKGKKALPQRRQSLVEKDVFLRSNLLKLSQKLALSGKKQARGSSYEKNPRVELVLSKGSDFRSVGSMTKVREQSFSHLSISGLSLEATWPAANSH